MNGNGVAYWAAVCNTVRSAAEAKPEEIAFVSSVKDLELNAGQSLRS
jgi:hypothetical protein